MKRNRNKKPEEQKGNESRSLQMQDARLHDGLLYDDPQMQGYRKPYAGNPGPLPQGLGRPSAEEYEDYEDFDEPTRADIGQDVRSILFMKEERDALADSIPPIEYEELPPVGDFAEDAVSPEAGFYADQPHDDGVPAEPYTGQPFDYGAPAAEPYAGQPFDYGAPAAEPYAGQPYDYGAGDTEPYRAASTATPPLEPYRGSLPGSEPPAPSQTSPIPPKKRGRRKTSRPYLFVSYAFVAIFLLLIGHLVYFNIADRDRILASPYNRRQDDLAANVRRGSILASDGSELAVTRTDELGNETRIYPYGSIFAHVVGYSTNGRSGLEAGTNMRLLTSHMDLIERAERELRGEKSLGDHVLTTLNVKLQQAAWWALGDRRGAVVVLDPKTGAILAMVSKPDFDPNTIGESWAAIVGDPDNSCLLNRSTQGLYVPGSTFKIVTALAYLREHGTFADYHFTCTGEISDGENTIHCAGGAVHGELDFAGAFAVSCNCAFSDMGRSLGAKAITDVCDSLLFGKTLPCPVLASKSRYDLASSDSVFRLMQTAFGQGGTTVTPWQMALLVSAIANGGTLMDPYIVEKVISSDGKVVEEHKARSYKNLLKEGEADALSSLLRQVVTGGSAVALSSLPAPAYGKTGSGEFTRSDGSRGTHAWFVGYAGEGRADLALAVIAEDSGSGADVAVPIANIVMNAFYS